MSDSRISFLQPVSKYGQFVPSGWSLYFLSDEKRATLVCTFKSAQQAVEAAIRFNDSIGAKRNHTETNSGIDL